MEEVKEYEENIIQINRVSKKTKGGNRLAFSVLAVVGDKKGQIGVSFGKAGDVASAIKKAVARAKKHLVKIPMKATTIPHDIRYKFGAAEIFLKPAPSGTGVRAGGAIRTVVAAAGIKDIVGKILGSNNKINNVQATFAALKQLKKEKELYQKGG